MIIGVLALQGAFAKHIEMLQKLGVKGVEIRTPAELLACDALIVPGGESTTILRQMTFIGLDKAFEVFAKSKPIFGTCAGLIIMSQQVVAFPLMSPFGLLDISVERNAYGRQVDSFETMVDLSLTPKDKGSKQFPAFFIRAPSIKKYGADVTVLATYQNQPILVRQGIHLGATFHPELTNDERIHSYFIDIVKKRP